MLLIGGFLTLLVGGIQSGLELATSISDNPNSGTTSSCGATLLPLLVFGGLGIALIATARSPSKPH